MSRQPGRDDVAGMAAGPELDALVAERVMGWPHVMRVGPTGEPFGIPPGGNQMLDAYEPVPHYSEEIGAAWLVVERMREMGREPVVAYRDGWRCAIRLPGTYETELPGRGFAIHAAAEVAERCETAAVAVCRVALLASIAIKPPEVKTTIKALAADVLREASGPLPCIEIARRALARGLCAENAEHARSKLAAVISKDMKSAAPHFARVGRGKITLTPEK